MIKSIELGYNASPSESDCRRQNVKANVVVLILASAEAAQFAIKISNKRCKNKALITTNPMENDQVENKDVLSTNTGRQHVRQLIREKTICHLAPLYIRPSSM